MSRPLRIGDRVRLRIRIGRGPRTVTTVKSFLPDVDGGVQLAERIDGFRMWHVTDLERVRPAKKMTANRERPF